MRGSEAGNVDPLTCGDLVAMRRFAYGRAEAEDGDFAAAAEMFGQALEHAPDWAAALFALGEARLGLGDLAGAAAAFRRTLAADPADTQGAQARLALLGGADAPVALPPAYVRRLFDDYARRFDAHLTGAPDYRGPALIADALDAAAPGRRFSSALDLGCGTGLMGEAIRGRVDRLVGIDLAPAMVERARARGVYDLLDAADAVPWLAGAAAGAFDCIVAADALPYFGRLKPLFAACRAALSDGGVMAVSAESFQGEGYRLGPAMRFAHAQPYVERTAAVCGLRVLLVRGQWARREHGIDAPGLIFVFSA
jgi:predicted TPR repeat methyltransferase